MRSWSPRNPGYSALISETPTTTLLAQKLASPPDNRSAREADLFPDAPDVQAAKLARMQTLVFEAFSAFAPVKDIEMRYDDHVSLFWGSNPTDVWGSAREISSGREN